MCGIAGVVHLDKEHVEPEILKAMGETLYHRGPDDQGMFVSADRRIGLYSRRLKVIDLSAAGRMPLANQQQTVQIVFNGEIYNYAELRRKLEKKYPFISQTDTEVILHLYEEEGIGCLEKLEGMFAFAIWDEQKKRLFVARDHLGKKPLYYYHRDGLFLFGSEIKALLKHPAVTKRINEDVIPSYLTFGYAPAPESFYKNIYKLPPASYLSLDLTGNIQQKNYWDLNLQSTQQVSEEEACQNVKELLSQAVQKRLISDVPLGAFLSGGIDSSIIVALMKEHSSHRPKTFSIGFDGDSSFNEAPYAKMVSEQFQTQHTEFIVKPEYEDLPEEILYFHDEPFGDSSALPTYILSKLARQQVTVVLTGDGGDEVFAGYQRFLGAQVMSKIQFVPQFVKQGALGLLNALYPGDRKSYYHFSAKAKRFLKASNQPVLDSYLMWISYFFGEENKSIRKNTGKMSFQESNVPENYREIFNHQKGTSLLNKLLYLNLKTYLPEDLLIKIDRMSMAHSLEARSPFLDKNLVEYVAALPDAMKIKKMQLKYLLKKAFKNKIPQQILNRPKHGFGVPLGHWFRTQLKSQVESQLLKPTARIYEYVDEQRLHALFDEHLSRKRDYGHQLWLLLMFELWLKKM